MASSTLLDEALLLHRLGRIDEAKVRYRQLLDADPDDPSALHLLGVIALQEKKPAEAEPLIRQAIAGRPDRAAYHNNLGNALRALSRPDEAVASYRKSLEFDASFVDALSNLGLVLRERGEIEEARTILERARALAPTNPLILNNLAIVFDAQGASDRAIALYREAVALDPRYMDACCNLGRALFNRKQYAEAVEWLRKAVDAGPAHADSHAQLGVGLREMARGEAMDEAVACLQRAVELEPGNADHENNLGIMLFDAGRFEEAEVHYRRALALAPNAGSALCNLGVLRLKQGLIDEAMAYFQEAARVNPMADGAHNGQAVAMVAMGHIAEAIPLIEEELRIHPESPDARTNLGMCLLTLGRLEEGWPHYDYRLKRRGYAVATGPQWQGDDIGEQTLLVYPEQGLGDNLQFARYFPLLRERCPRARIVYPCPESLTRFFKRAFAAAGIEMFSRDENVHLPEGCQVGLMSLPRIFGTTLETIPAAVPYLTADPDLARPWAKRLAATARPRVGLAWAGNPDFANDRIRSIAPETFVRLLDVPGVAYVNLQKRPAGSAPPWPDTVMDWMEDVRDFADTAALVEQLDLVISVDTAVAHLAGAMGRPVWLLNRMNTDWRWMLDRDDSPWYPSMRILRQPSLGDWKSVMEMARLALVELVASRDWT